MTMKAKRKSAYEIPYAQVELTGDDQHRALVWWQAGEDYHPLVCPICGAVLKVAPTEAALTCPTRWCAYVTREIPWGVYVAWRRYVEEKGE